MNLFSIREGVGIALEALRANKVRAVLTTLGVVIGVATVVAMAAIIGGIRGAVTDMMEGLGPENFVVSRFDQTQLRFVDSGGNPPWHGTPKITLAEARLIRDLPSIRSVSPDVDFQISVRHGPDVLESVAATANDADWIDYTRGEFVAGRNFLPAEVARAERLLVLSDGLAEALFGEAEAAVGRQLRLADEPFQVVGVFAPRENIFTAFVSNFLVVPYTTGLRHLPIDDELLGLLVVPAVGVSQDVAMDDVTAALRTARGLRPGDDNDFAVIRQEAFVQLFDRLTGVFFLVMLILSSIGLLVGGVGVVAIMMISVTERTREIGVRKALGATRREILWQFLVESVTVTVVGASIGLVLGGAGALVLAAATPIQAAVPAWAVVAALLVAALSGIGFGLYPANRAARLDPVDALRYE